MNFRIKATRVIELWSVGLPECCRWRHRWRHRWRYPRIQPQTESEYQAHRERRYAYWRLLLEKPLPKGRGCSQWLLKMVQTSAHCLIYHINPDRGRLHSESLCQRVTMGTITIVTAKLWANEWKKVWHNDRMNLHIWREVPIKCTLTVKIWQLVTSPRAQINVVDIHTRRHYSRVPCHLHGYLHYKHIANWISSRSA